MTNKLSLILFMIAPLFLSQALASQTDVKCTGEGPSEDIARRVAISQCIATVSYQLIGSYRVQSLSTETEKSVGYHQEVSFDQEVSGLQCEIVNEKIQNEDSTFHADVICRFDLTNFKKVPKTVKSVGGYLVSSDRNVILTTIPQCETILVRGEKPRVVDCVSNPQSVTVFSTDQELIIRTSGYVPKHIIPFEIKNNTLEVYLENN